ncbi:WhiB family transcriptional regulator [Microtetraspora malaysiensis]|uniref:WhiB family transcriptional regulator n=1 Tax=Microtetraspora malaysiensis TaxID=161358 RepID=A0ABW6SKA3_9ACTN
MTRADAVRKDDEAACASEDPELFFPARYTSQYRRQIEAAKAICKGCRRRPKCLRYALDNPGETRFGIWGGKTPLERARMCK